MAATLRDVAERAGVSLATVSRVLNGATTVDPALAERVRSAAGDLGYRANLLARGLRQQRTNIVGIVVPQIANPFFSALMQAVSRRLRATSRTLLLADAEDDPDVEAAALDRLADHGVDGLLLAPVDEHASGAAAARVADRVPMIFLDRAAEGVAADLVSVDQKAGMDAVLSHLAVDGPARTRLVSAAPVDSVARERAEAYASAVASGRVRDTHEPLLGSFTSGWGQQAARCLLDAGELPEALVCGNDLIAIGALTVLTEHGVAVPADVRVTGFDDVGLATVTTPRLTTVRQPLDGLANAAVALLEDRIERGTQAPPRQRRLAPDLIMRASTGGHA